MKRRTQEEARIARKLSSEALDRIRADNAHPGFDYSAALLELNRVYGYDEIAEFCRYRSKASIAKVVSGSRVPSHPQGEALYIMFVETFKRKPPNKRFQE